MYSTNQLVLEIFENLCDAFLSPSQKRVIFLYCGINTGVPPMSISTIAARIGKTVLQTQQILQAALRVLPLRRLLVLKSHLDDPEHKYHQGLSEAQRLALRRLINGAVQLHQRVSQTDAAVKPAPQPANRPAVQAPTERSQPAPAFLSVHDRVTQALEKLGRPAHIERIYAQADWGRPHGRVSMPAVLQTLRNDKGFVALGKEVFALAKWENRHSQQPDQLLYCPPLPIHDALPSVRYLEFVLELLAQLQQSPMTVVEVWQWASRRVVGRTSAKDIFDLHYALGLHQELRYVQDVQDKARLLRPLIQVGNDLGVFRLQCLRTLLARAPFMAQTLAAVAHEQRTTFERVASLAYEDARDAGDLRARLRLLEAFGALREERGAWLLSGLGEQLLAELPSAPSLWGVQTSVVVQADDDDEIGLLEL